LDPAPLRCAGCCRLPANRAFSDQRCADRRFPRSLASVRGEGMRSTNSAQTAPIRPAPRATRAGRPGTGRGRVRSPGCGRRPGRPGRSCPGPQPCEPAPSLGHIDHLVGLALEQQQRKRQASRGTPATAVQPCRLPEELGRGLQPPQRIRADEVQVGRVGRVQLWGQGDMGRHAVGAIRCPTTTCISRAGDSLTSAVSTGPSSSSPDSDAGRWAA
jgi:hypothetical protein